MTILKTDTVSGIGTEGTVFEGDITFDSLNYMTLPKGTTTQSNRGRGVFAGGYAYNAQYFKSIDYINIQSSGNFIDFGDLTQAVHNDPGCCSSSTRGIIAGGYIQPANGGVNNMEYVTIATTSNSTDFGDLSQDNDGKKWGMGGPIGNETRGLFVAGMGPSWLTRIEYVTIATLGNAAEFGEVTEGRKYLAATSNSTRGVAGGGNKSPNAATNTIDYVTLASTGDATNFGDLTVGRQENSATASTTRAVFGSGVTYSPTVHHNTLDYITIATTGNATDFGDISGYNGSGNHAVSNSTRGVWAGNNQYPVYSNTVYYVNIATTGNTIEFGDQNHSGCSGQASFSDSHGGLSE